MKFKKLLGGGLLATVLALGVGAGLAVRSESKEADAATSETTFYVDARLPLANTGVWGKHGATNNDIKVHTYGPDSKDHWIYDTASGRSFVTVNGVEYVSFSIASTPDVTGMEVYCWDKTYTQNYSIWLTFSSATEGQNLIVVENTSESANQNAHFSTLDIGTTVDVTKHGICDGDLEHSWVIETVPAEKGVSYPVPASIRLENYHFGGWFTESDCLESHRYTAQVLNDDLDLYAKFTTLSKNSYIYYLQDGETNNYVYTWGGEKEFGEDDGQSIASIGAELHGVLNFENKTQYIYKIPFSSEAADTKVQFYYGSWTGKSAEMQLTAGAAYWWTGANVDVGAAIDLLLKIEAARNSTQYKGLDYSVCGIDKDTAKDFIDEYDSTLTDEGREFVDGTYTKTYDPSKSASESPSEVQVKYSLIIDKLREIASGNGPSANTKGISLFGDIDNSTPIMLVVIISVVSLTAVGGYIFLKRRKEN